MISEVNEFRRNLVSGDWVLVAPGRRKKAPQKEYEKLSFSKEGCPFENPESSGNEVISYFPHKDNWEIIVMKNKYPAVHGGVCGPMKNVGPFEIFDADGFHEIVITRDHDKSFPDFTTEKTFNLLSVYRERYKEIAKDECGQYISIFHNHGKEAGASIYHPHSQIISTPILPSDVMKNINGAEDFYNKYNKKVHNLIIEWEVGENKRIVEENNSFIAFCPFVSKKPYEIRIFPKKQSPHFEEITDDELNSLAQILNSVLLRLKMALNDPPFNFFIHTAPVKRGTGSINPDYYHWHIEIIPHLKIDAGFEMGTGIEVNIVDPDEAAENLRNQK